MISKKKNLYWWLTLFLCALLFACDGDGPTESKETSFAAFEWNYISTVNDCGQGQGCGIQFFDRSTNSERWQWNFGDGGTSNLRDPLHFYRDDDCTRGQRCQFIVNLQVCPETDLRFDDERCSQVTNVVSVPPPSG